MTLTTRPYQCPLTLFVFLTIFTTCIISSPTIHHDYCVIGAGPSGLQLGYYLQQKNRDYVIFERSNVSGKCEIYLTCTCILKILAREEFVWRMKVKTLGELSCKVFFILLGATEYRVAKNCQH